MNTAMKSVEETVAILPHGAKGYQTFPVLDAEGKELPGVIHITPEEYDGILCRELMFNADLSGTEPFALTAAEQAEQDAAAAERQKQANISAIKARMADLDYDINACADGVVKAKSEAEYRAERVALRNELRELEGKTVLSVGGIK